MPYVEPLPFSSPCQPPRWNVAALPHAAAPCRDPRWPAILDTLQGLRGARRRSVRIVDADCGGGSLLLHAVRAARSLGFVAIEARGVDRSPAAIGRARAAAALLADPAIGVSFEIGDVAAALEGERAFPADIVVWHGGTAAMAGAIASAGDRIIGDLPPPRRIAA